MLWYISGEIVKWVKVQTIICAACIHTSCADSVVAVKFFSELDFTEAKYNGKN